MLLTEPQHQCFRNCPGPPASHGESGSPPLAGSCAWPARQCGLRPSRPASPEVLRRQSLRHSEPCGEKGSPTKLQRTMLPTPPSPLTRPSGTVRHWWGNWGVQGDGQNQLMLPCWWPPPPATCPAASEGSPGPTCQPRPGSPSGCPAQQPSQDGDRVWAPGQIPLLGLAPLNVPSVFYSPPRVAEPTLPGSHTDTHTHSLPEESRLVSGLSPSLPHLTASPPTTISPASLPGTQSERARPGQSNFRTPVLTLLWGRGEVTLLLWTRPKFRDS